MTEEKKEAFVNSATMTKRIPWEGSVDGVDVDEIVVKCYRPNRYMVRKALMEAADKYMREHPGADGGLGGDMVEAERQLAMMMIKSWSLPKPPKMAWDWLDPELGDLISDAIGIKDVFALKETKDDKGGKVSASEEVEVAKN